MTNLNDKRVTLDLATLFRVMPWILMGDKRDLQSLVTMALKESKGFIDTGPRLKHMRGMMHTWLQCVNVRVDPNTIEMIVQEVARQVDDTVTDQYDDELGGTPA